MSTTSTTSLLDRVSTHVETIDARAATIDGKRVLAVLLALVTSPLIAIGIVAVVVWTILRWAIAGVLEGWDIGQRAVTHLTQSQTQSQGRGPNRGS